MLPRCVWAFFVLIVAAAAADPAPDQTEPNSIALVTSWTPPVYPEAARKAKQEGSVTVQLTVDEQGRVSDIEVVESTNPVFDAPAIEAVQQWKFQPARENGASVPCGLRYELPFTLAALKRKPGLLPPVPPEVAPRTPPQPIVQPAPDYPAELEELKIGGEVACQFEVSRTGRVEKIRVLGATHPAFVPLAMKTLQEWRYEPAREGRAPISSMQQAHLDFEPFGFDRAAQVKAVGASVLGESGEPDPDAPQPEPLAILEPVFPRDAFLAGETGEAEIEATLTSRGLLTDIAVCHASRPEFGEALAAAAAHWNFRLATANGHGVTSRLRIHHTFDPNSAAYAATRQIAEALAANTIGSTKGLDEKLTPWWRVGGVYPARLRRDAIPGDVVVEIIIDRNGRVRLPHIVKTSHPDFGWAALTAVSCWVFAPPHRGGEPVDVRVQVPFSFKPDA